MSANDIEAQAMEWLVRMDALEGADGAGAEAARLREQFNAWCEGDARRHAAYIRLSAAWRKADQLKRLRVPDGAVDLDILAPAISSPGEVGSSHKTFISRKISLAAAVALALIGAAAWLAFDNFSGQTYATGVGGFQRLLLTDGSTVELDTDSRIRVRFTSGRREIAMLRGQANFKVSRDTHRPFEVAAGDTTVRALGTAFSIRLRDRNQIEVLVTEGRVAVGTREDAPTLSAGEGVLVRPGTGGLEPLKMTSDLPRHLSWTQGRLAFDGETLVQAVAEFNRYNPRQLVIADPAIETIRVGGSFQPTDPQSFVTALERSFGVSVESADAKEIRLIRAVQ